MSFSDVVKKVDPFAGRMLGFGESDRKKGNPRAQYYGGSKEATEKERKRFREAVAKSEGRASSGLKFGQRVNSEADRRNQGILDNQERQGRAQQTLGSTSGIAADQAMADYGAGRGAQLDNAGKLETLALNAPQNYQATAQQAFNAQQQANANQANAIAARGGAGGLRTALATNAGANAQAQQQANITQANEYNQLLEMQQAGLTNATNIRSNVGAQDQSAAGLQAGRQQAANNLEASYLRDRANVTNNDANVGLTVAGMRTNAGLAQQGMNLNARSRLEEAQLGASQNYENQRQQAAKQQYTQDWFPMAKFNQPA